MEELPVPLLEPAVEAARRALAGLEPEEVPAALRRLTAYQGGRLPPPFLRRLVKELKESEWLREKTREAWPEADPEADEPALRASALFLVRPPGWEYELGRLAGAHRVEETDREREGLERRVRHLEDELAETRRRLEEAGRRLERSREDARRRVQEARADVRGARQAGAAEAREARRRARELEEEADRLARRLEEEGERVALLRGELGRARRGGEPTEVGSLDPPVWAVRDPLELARLLDETVLAARPTPRVGGQAAEAPAGPLRLPPGLVPDGVAAVDWLLEGHVPAVLIVDGYNLAFALGEAPGRPASREEVGWALGRLRRRARAPLRVVVVYDSSLPGGPGVDTGPGGIEVRFTEEGGSADEEIVALAGRVRGPVVVVSDDRRVREEAEAAGALGLWSKGLAAWISER